MKHIKVFLTVMCVSLATGCATVPSGPSIRVFPPAGKPYDLFVSEDAFCRHAAERRIGLQPQEVADQNTATGAFVGTAVGTGIGALLGAASGDAGAGAVIGGISGLLIGSAAGADAGRFEGHEAQWHYDSAYLQCMHAHGNQGYNSGQRYYRRRGVIAPPPSGYGAVPPDYIPLYPPPGTPPPPLAGPSR